MIKVLIVLACILLMLGTQAKRDEELEETRYLTDREWE